jgi:hypothetical protein
MELGRGSDMDVLDRSVYEAGSRVELPTMTLNRHLTVLRGAASPDDEALLVRRCNRLDRRWQGDLLLTVTRRRLLLTRERFLRGTHLYLDADRADVTGVRWESHERMPGLELSFDHGAVRYMLWLPAFQPEHMSDIEVELAGTFDEQTT